MLMLPRCLRRCAIMLRLLYADDDAAPADALMLMPS